MIYGTSIIGAGGFSVSTIGWVLIGMKSQAEKSLNNFVTTVTNNVVKRCLEVHFKQLATKSA